VRIELTVNGVARAVEVYPLKRLLDVIREDLALTGTKEGCGEGECGACAVVLDGELVDSCLVAACQVQGSQVLTVEGLAPGGRLTPLQQAFLARGAAQCGICTPGMLVAAQCFLAGVAEPTDHAVREALAGNLCRCTGYQKIVDAVRLATALQAAAPEEGR
jgi:carbon-monoxide dehydrogenase small subunit